MGYPWSIPRLSPGYIRATLEAPPVLTQGYPYVYPQATFGLPMGPEPGTSGLEKTAPSGELEFSSRSN